MWSHLWELHIGAYWQPGMAWDLTPLARSQNLNFKILDSVKPFMGIEYGSPLAARNELVSHLMVNLKMKFQNIRFCEAIYENCPLKPPGSPECLEVSHLMVNLKVKFQNIRFCEVIYEKCIWEPPGSPEWVEVSHLLADLKMTCKFPASGCQNKRSATR